MSDTPSPSPEERIKALEKQLEELQKHLGTEKATSNVPRAKKPAKNMAWLSLIFLVLPVIAYWGFSTGLKGRFSAQGAILGNWSVQARDCRSGAAYIPQFWGMVVKSGKAKEPKFEVQGDSPKNGKVLVWGPEFETPVTLDKNLCSVYEIEIKRNGSKVNNVVAIEGYVKLDCSLAESGKFIADIQFRNCY